MSKQSELFRTFDGHLWRNRDQRLVRQKFNWHFARISCARELAATLRAGSTTSWGGYPLFLLCDDGSPLCFKCARKEFKTIARSMIQKGWRDSWAIAACEVNYEDPDLMCCHCNERIPSAYAEESALGQDPNPIDDSVKVCPDCEQPNQFGEVCSSCQHDRQVEIQENADRGLFGDY